MSLGFILTPGRWVKNPRYDWFVKFYRGLGRYWWDKGYKSTARSLWGRIPHIPEYIFEEEEIVIPPPPPPPPPPVEYLWRYSCAINFFKWQRKQIESLEGQLTLTQFTGDDVDRMYEQPRESPPLNIPIHHDYFGALCQIWREDKDPTTPTIAEENLKDFLIEWIETEYGWKAGLYGPKDWVFRMGGGWQLVPMDEELIDLKRMVIEDHYGAEVYSREYYV